MKSWSRAYREISAVIERLEQDQLLYVADNYIERMRALDILELHMTEDIEPVNNPSLSAAEQVSLIQRGTALKQKLEAANEKLFSTLLERIRADDRAAVKQFFQHAAQQVARKDADDDLGYDELDMLVNGLLEVAFVPAESAERDADMFFYQPTPARVILKLIDELHVTEGDIFYDLGSGLGHVPILVNLLTGIKTIGIEREESYIGYSVECLKKLGLPNVEFIQADARHVDYYDGTIFYMYTPFQGELMQQVLSKLEAQSRQRAIRICTYGPCTLQVGRQKWLRPVFQTGKREDRFSIFSNG